MLRPIQLTTKLPHAMAHPPNIRTLTRPISPSTSQQTYHKLWPIHLCTNLAHKKWPYLTSPHLSPNHEGHWGTKDDFTVSYPFLCSPLPSGTWQTPGLSIPWFCLPTSSSVCLVFFPPSLRLARWFWPDLMNGRLVHTNAVCTSLRWSGLHVAWLLAGVSNMVFVWDV